MSAMRPAVELKTPEGIAVSFALAEPAERIKAFVVDLLVIGLLTGAAALLAEALSDALGVGALVFEALALVAAFCARTFYFAWCELNMQGRTWGKRLAGIRVIARDGGPLTGDMIFARNLTRELELFLPGVVAFMPDAIAEGLPDWVKAASLVWIGVLLFFPMLNSRRARVGDLLAGTLVVVTPQAQLLRDLAERKSFRRRRRYRFTPEQLDIYGIHELQVLEDILRRDRVDPHLASEVSKRIRAKIKWPAKPAVDDQVFLEEFYAAQRARLEQQMIMGERRNFKRQ